MLKVSETLIGRSNTIYENGVRDMIPSLVYYLVILGSILLLFSKASIVTGKVAEDEAVPKAVAKAFAILLINLNGRLLVITP